MTPSEAAIILKCDSVRFIDLGDVKFALRQINKNTKDDKSSEWRNEKNEVVHFDYIHEEVVASGKTEKELDDSIQKYSELMECSRKQNGNELETSRK